MSSAGHGPIALWARRPRIERLGFGDRRVWIGRSGQQQQWCTNLRDVLDWLQLRFCHADVFAHEMNDRRGERTSESAERAEPCAEPVTRCLTNGRIDRLEHEGVNGERPGTKQRGRSAHR